MSTPPFFPHVISPLPPGWTGHLSPDGHPYYYNAQTQESTYVRPIPSFQAVASAQMRSHKEEKPLFKKQVPETNWLRIITNLGNIFYFDKLEKKSLWTIPNEISGAVITMEKKEHEDEFRAQQDMLDRVAEAEEIRQAQVDRIKQEMKGMVKRKPDEETPLDELVIAKKARINAEEGGEESEEDSEEEEEEEEWQREAAAQLAAEAEEERKRQEEEQKRKEEEEKRQKEAEEEQRSHAASGFKMPEKVDLSIDEAKALFKTLLKEKDISPLEPWDVSLPKFVNDPRYVLLPSVAARREAFDEYCRDRARELRELAVRKEKQPSDSKQEFERLLEQEVKSTRTGWTEFRRTWKKDRRYYGWGRDDREREKRFRDFLKDLGEKKRAAAQKAETDFFLLLREHQEELLKEVSWKEIKKHLSHDLRYDAVGSSSLREELFNTFMKGSAQNPSSATKDEALPSGGAPLSKQERKERAVKEREQKVKAELSRVEMNNERSRMGINQEEGERDYMSMLVDAIRDPQTTWDDALPYLKADPRFRNSPLPANLQLNLFGSHISHLRQKHITNLHGLFRSHSASLATPISDLPLQTLLKSLPATKLGLDIYQLEHEYDKWQRERSTNARKAFDEMLAENSFVEFWGRLGKIGGEGVEGGVKADDLGEDEGEGGGGKVDMKVLAKKVELEEMERVLRNDKRFTVFDHIPEQREKWLREYLANLSAPKLSVHVA